MFDYTQNIMVGTRLSLSGVYLLDGKGKSVETIPGEPMFLIFKRYSISKAVAFCTLTFDYDGMKTGQLIKCLTMDLKLISAPDTISLKTNDLPDI